MSQILLTSPARGTVASYRAPKAAFNRPGLEIRRTEVTPLYQGLTGRGALPFDAVVARVDLRANRIFPFVNSRINYGVFYTPDFDARKMSVFDQAAEVRNRHGLGTPVLLTPGNSNLFTNIGYWAAAKQDHNYDAQSALFRHFQEKLEGPQNAFIVREDGSVEIGTVDPRHVLEDQAITSALGGGVLIKDGRALELEDENGAGRPAYQDLLGDIQHIFSRGVYTKDQELPIKLLSLERTGECFDINALSSPIDFMLHFNRWGNYLYKRKNDLPMQIRQLLEGQGTVIQGKVTAPIPRATFNHFFAATTEDPFELVLFGTFDSDRPSKEKVRKGLYIEDTALLGKALAKEMGLEVKNAIALCNGSEPLMWTDGFEIASYDGMSRPLTSSLLFFAS